MNETTVLYCIFCYLFAIGNMIENGMDADRFFTFVFAPITLPVVLGKKLK